MACFLEGKEERKFSGNFHDLFVAVTGSELAALDGSASGVLSL